MQVARERRLATLPSLPFPLLQEPLPQQERIQYSTVDDIHYSENAMLLFCHNTVIKRLMAYKDQRYDQVELQKRHESLLEGLNWNRKFTPGVYLGLVPIYDWKLDQRKIGLGKLLRNPAPNNLVPNVEYALLMRKLPKEYRLDYLLAGGASISNLFYAYELTQFLSKMHLRLLEDDAYVPTDSESWGSVSQLRSKLIHNLDVVDNPVGVKKEVLQGESYKHLRSFSCVLRNELLPIFENTEYRSYFEQRVRQRFIRRCHGDLKGRNIWVLPSEYAQTQQMQQRICLLDVIDFNPNYCHIDVLSDFAMFAVDMQIRTSSRHLTSYMIEDYLHQMGQTDKASRSVLRYYLVEKAFVGAYVSILYDNLPDFGEAYLQAAKRNLADLKRLISISYEAIPGIIVE